MEEPAIVPLPSGIPCAYEAIVRERLRPPDAPGTVDLVETDLFLQPCRGTVRSGETVTLRFGPPAELTLAVRTEPPLPIRTILHLELHVEQGGRTERHGLRVGASDDRERAEIRHTFQAAPGAATLRWRRGTPDVAGAEVAFAPGGPLDVVLEAGKPVEVPLTLAIDAGPALAALAGRGPVRLEPRGPGGAAVPRDGIVVIAFRVSGAEGDVDEWGRWDGFPEEGPVELEAESREEWTHLLVAGGPHLVGEPRPFPGTEIVTVDLRPAGYLVVVPDALPPPGSGALTLRRAGGSPIPLVDLEADGSWELDSFATAVPVTAGVVVGPLPEGEHHFEALLGGVRVGEASATVRAGRVEVLRVPTR
jgi:hypothetical protein